LPYQDDWENFYGFFQKETPDALKAFWSSNAARTSTKLSDHRRHRFFKKETPDALKASGVVTGF
jgi:hypothetical protein